MESGWQKLQKEGHQRSRGKTSRIAISSLEYGAWVTKTQFAAHGHVHDAVGLLLDFSVRDIQIRVRDRFVLEFQTREAESFVVLDTSGEQTSIFITLKHPPRVYDHKDPSDDLEYSRRLSRIPVTPSGGLKRQTLASCRTIRLIFPSGSSRIIDTVLDFCFAVDKEIYQAQITPVEPVEEILTPFEDTKHKNSLDVLWAWLCLKSANGFVAERFGRSFFEKLDDCSESLAASVLYGVAKLSDQNLFLDPLEAYDVALRTGIGTKDLDDAQRHCRVPRVVSTPTRLVYYMPEIMQTNRVLREWGDQAEFLRVMIRDDSFSKLSTIKGKLDAVLREIMNLLQGTICVGHLRFQFLGCSNSQVRDHGCYFVDVSKEADLVTKIRSWAGNLDGITNVAKYVARLGQVFSTSTKTIEVDVRDCAQIPDIERNGYCFTDGIGKISPDLAKEVAAKLGTWEVVPCAFQIRFGGCKGVVAVDPKIHEQHPGKHMLYRESMLKYWSSHTTIEVLSCVALPQELYLNQQLIMLLNHLGVPDENFLKLMYDSLAGLSKMFTDEEVARSKLKDIKCGIDWKAFESSKFLVTTDPYLRSMLVALYRTQLKGLRERSRILVNANDARVLIGTVDETGTLEYGQVFIQISKYVQNPGVEPTVLQRKVVIGKSPCLHRGDVRVFDAVDCPALHHMCDCVVFPSKGQRPHPNELSGSDLDGDLYHVIWGPYLMPTLPNKEPMNYDANKTVLRDECVTSQDMLNFLKENIEFDCIGQIDNTHKALADQRGIDSEACNELAKLHSQAVDAPKTGQWATVPRPIRKLLTKYPDFMMKHVRPSYPSDKVLGKMFRECNKFMDTCHVQWTTLNTSGAATMGRMFHIDGMDAFLEDARAQRRQYNGKLKELMSMYGVVTEAEFMSGFVEQLHEKIGNQARDVSGIISTFRSRLFEKFKDIFFQDERIQQSNGVVDEEQALRKAAAWHYVCHSPSEPRETYTVGKATMAFMSFAWIPYKYILKLFERNSAAGMIENTKQRIGRDVYDLLEKSMPRLFYGFDEMIAAKEWIKRALETRKDLLIPMLYGMSYVFLFDEYRPQTELLLWFTGLDAYLRKAEPLNRRNLKEMLNSVESCLHGCGVKCRVTACGKATVLTFRFYMESLDKNMTGHIALDPFCWVQSALLLEYIYNDPWLLPLLRVVIKWAHATEFVGSFKHAIIDSLSVCFMLVDYCLTSGAIKQPIDPDKILADLIGEQFECFADPEVWIEITDRLFLERPHGEEAMGDLLLGFFSVHERSGANAVHPSLEKVLGCSYYSQTCSVDSMRQLQDEMQRALHKLSFHGSIQQLFQPVETEKILHLPGQTAHRMIGSEQFFARYFSSRTRTRVEVHQKGDVDGGLLIKTNGTYNAIHYLERLLQEYMERSEALDYTLVQLPGVMELFVKHSHKCIIEGIKDTSEKEVSLEDYQGQRHPEDDNRGLYIIRVMTPSEEIPKALYDLGSAKFLDFKSFFLERLEMVRSSECYSPFVHGDLMLEVHFGTLYLMSPPKETMEDPEGMSLEQLPLQDGHQQCITRLLRWKDELNALSEASKQDASGHHPRMAFFPKLHRSISEAAAKKLLEDYGLQETGQTECYVLSLRGKAHGVTAVYHSNLGLKNVLFPPIRWMLVDIKRFYADRTEADVRFNLSSQAECKSKTVVERVAQGVCRLNRHNGPASIARDLIPLVHTFKRIQRRDFTLQNTDSHFWKCVCLRLDSLIVTSRPKLRGHEGLMTEKYLDLKLVVDLKRLPDRPPDVFIKELWYRAMCLSDQLRMASAK